MLPVPFRDADGESDEEEVVEKPPKRRRRSGQEKDGSMGGWEGRGRRRTEALEKAKKMQRLETKERKRQRSSQLQRITRRHFINALTDITSTRFPHHQERNAPALSAKPRSPTT